MYVKTINRKFPKNCAHGSRFTVLVEERRNSNANVFIVLTHLYTSRVSCQKGPICHA